MFYNILKRSFQLNLKHVNNFNVLRSSSSGAPRNDITDAMDIEANLFDNSLIKHEPVSTREALRKNRPKGAAKPQRKVKDQSFSVTPPQKFSIPPAPRPPPVPVAVIKDSELNLEFVRLKLQDPLTSTLLTTVRSRKRRDKNGQIIIEGRRLIKEALECGLKMRTLIFSQKDQLALLKEEVALAQQESRTKIYKVPHHDLKTWSSLVTPPGLLAVFDRPSEQGLKKNLTEQQRLGTQPLPIIVVCDNIREPNNLGSIIRTCAALPCSQVVVTRGCCDPWESKALRGGCGGQFRVPIRDDVSWEELSKTIEADTADDCHVFIAESNKGKLANRQAIDYADIAQIGTKNLLIIGGESHGVSEEAYSFMNLVGAKGKCVYIPLAAGIDSLNVASALTLLLFEFRRKLNPPESQSNDV